MRPGDASKRVDASTEPATVLLEVCDEDGVVQIWQGTSAVAGDTVTEDLSNTGSRQRNSVELARAAKWDALDAEQADRQSAAASVRSVADGELVGRSASGVSLSGPEQTALLSELSTAVRDLTLLVEGLAATPD